MIFHPKVPLLAFSNQHIDMSIRLVRALRQGQGLFRTALRRQAVAPLNDFQQAELKINVERALTQEREVRAALISG